MIRSNKRLLSFSTAAIAAAGRKICLKTKIFCSFQSPFILLQWKYKIISFSLIRLKFLFLNKGKQLGKSTENNYLVRSAWQNEFTPSPLISHLFHKLACFAFYHSIKENIGPLFSQIDLVKMIELNIKIVKPFSKPLLTYKY